MRVIKSIWRTFYYAIHESLGIDLVVQPTSMWISPSVNKSYDLVLPPRTRAHLNDIILYQSSNHQPSQSLLPTIGPPTVSAGPTQS